MNTKPIPALVALSASGITCVLSILQQVKFSVFVLRFAVVAALFYIIGSVIRVVIDRAFKVDAEETEKQEQATKDASPDDAADSAAEQDADDENGDAENDRKS